MNHFKSDLNSKLVGLIGNPLDHSVSPKLHNALYQYYGINAVYLPFVLEEEQLPDFLHAAKTLKMSGFGVTMPFKDKILRYIDDAEESAKMFNCVNQVQIRPDGSTHGIATDGLGMCQAIEHTGFRISGKNAMVLGAGAISGVIGYELAQRGAQRVVFFNRTLEKAREIAKKVCQTTGVTTDYKPLERSELDAVAPESQLVVQCTSLGMYGMNQDFDYLGFIDLLPEGSLVADAIYNPECTSILAKARQRGLTTVDGVQMLVWQLLRNLEHNVSFRGVEEEGLKYADECMRSFIRSKDPKASEAEA